MTRVPKCFCDAHSRDELMIIAADAARSTTGLITSHTP